MQNLRETSKTCEKKQVVANGPKRKKRWQEKIWKKRLNISWGDWDYFNQTQVCELKFFHFRYRGLSDFEDNRKGAGKAMGAPPKK